MRGPAIGIMAKAPLPGLAKTRLAATFGAEAAARLAEAMLADTAGIVRGLCVAAYAFVTPAQHCASVSSLVRLPALPQEEGDLGRRLAAAFETLFARGHAPVVLIGTDTPHLPQACLRSVLALACTNPEAAVVGPAEDGGYWAIALSRPRPALFEAIPWSTPRVLEATRRAAAAIGILLLEGPVSFDIDTAQDLIRFGAEAWEQGHAAPRTAAVAAALIASRQGARVPTVAAGTGEETSS
ncbi:MAG: TIGR04282 family arsenosugar biosynthesis glycosyltransferase [Acetobacteraceae bacterium]|nr:TIGR04282 family arsenosugar biosynthesis glycosyltransferase [Acetobacteraceae bacterium]